MKERPILFSGPMVRAILDGRKTQTRRVMTPPAPSGTTRYLNGIEREQDRWWPCSESDYTGAAVRCRYGVAGDRLWVREAWAKDSMIASGVRYYATDNVHELRRKRPSIHMPRWASRITLEITGVRIEKLNSISANDCLSEGIHVPEINDGAIRGGHAFNAYVRLWESINWKKGSRWDDNPWVWVVEFRRIDGQV